MNSRPTGFHLKNSTYIDVHKECGGGVFGFDLEKFNRLMFDNYGILMSYSGRPNVIFDLGKFLIFQLKYPECIDEITYE